MVFEIGGSHGHTAHAAVLITHLEGYQLFQQFLSVVYVSDLIDEDAEGGDEGRAVLFGDEDIAVQTLLMAYTVSTTSTKLSTGDPVGTSVAKVGSVLGTSVAGGSVTSSVGMVGSWVSFVGEVVESVLSVGAVVPSVGAVVLSVGPVVSMVLGSVGSSSPGIQPAKEVIMQMTRSSVRIFLSVLCFIDNLHFDLFEMGGKTKKRAGRMVDTKLPALLGD